VQTTNAAPLFTHYRRVEFADTDSGGIVHFSRFLVFMETAEHEMLRQRGLTPLADDHGRSIGWPRVEARCEYLKPALLGDDLAIEVRLARRGERSMTYEFRIARGAEILAKGSMSSVCCVLQSDRPPQAIPFPDFIADKLPDGSK
jgi:4-hydroxybenzoyl-CoA thioesterase/acyl-CoA thioester hydrolase